MSKIEIYTNKTCKYCKQLKEELSNKNVEFIDKDTSEFKKEWSKIVNLTGLPTVPTIFYKENYFCANRDFHNPQNVIDLLEHFTVSKYSYDLRCLEQLKTMNYNVATAFRKMEQAIIQLTNKIKDEHKSTS